MKGGIRVNLLTQAFGGSVWAGNALRDLKLLLGASTMTEDLKPTGADEPAIIRKPIVIPVDTETGDGTRSVTKDRLPGDIETTATVKDGASVVRKPIDLSAATTTSDDGDRSVTKDRMPGEIMPVETDTKPLVVRKPIVIKPQSEA